MEWTTIPIELLERILVSTASPKTIANACRTCKSWNAVDQDPHLWKHLYISISNVRINDTIDWKKKVVDLVLVRKNVKTGRCVVRTLAACQRLDTRVTLEFDNFTSFNDHCLVNWLTMENYGSYGGVTRSDSHLINMITEEVINIDVQKVFFLNHYVASSPTNYYGGANFQNIKVQQFDPTSNNKKLSFDEALKFDMPDHPRSVIKNHCVDSKYLGFIEFGWNSASKIYVVNAETGQIVHLQSTKLQTSGNVQLCDTVLVFHNKDTLSFVDILTGKETKKRKFATPLVPGFMVDNTIALRVADKIILYNFKNDTEVTYPAGETPVSAVTMIYNDMWLFQRAAVLLFYDMKDGSFVNALALKQSRSEKLSLLSDGRLGFAQENGCRAISFVDSEVNRRITVKLMNEKGRTSTHEISAFELPQFYANNVNEGVEKMTSCIVPYAPRPTTDERFVMIFSPSEHSNKKVNSTATTLLSSSVAPTHVNTPYQGWKFDKFPLPEKTEIVAQVYGNALIVCEKKIDGRWQLASWVV